MGLRLHYPADIVGKDLEKMMRLFCIQVAVFIKDVCVVTRAEKGSRMRRILEFKEQFEIFLIALIVLPRLPQIYVADVVNQLKKNGLNPKEFIKNITMVASSVPIVG